MASPDFSSDEGEIIENPPHPKDAPSDRSRNSQTPDLAGTAMASSDINGGAHRRCRSPRGLKRAREDRASEQASARDDDRRMRHRMDDEPTYDSRRSRYRYEDLDQPSSRGLISRHYHTHSGHSQDALPSRPRCRGYDRDRDRGSYRDRYGGPAGGRRSGRSRSPRGTREKGGRMDRRSDCQANGGQTGHIPYSDPTESSHRDSMPTQTSATENSLTKTSQGRTDNRSVAYATSRQNASSEVAEAPAVEQDADWEEAEPVDVEAEIERRRRARMEAYKRAMMNEGAATTASPAAASPLAQDARERSQPSAPATTIQSTESGPSTEVRHDRQVTDSPPTHAAAAGPRHTESPGALDVANDQELINTHGEAKDSDEDGPSAADYDPTAHMQEDERRDELRQGHPNLRGEAAREIQPVEEPSHKTSNNDDDDEGGFDMFAEDFDENKFAPVSETKLDGATKAHTDDQAQAAGAPAGGLLEEDDKDGYYKLRPGEVLNGRYQIQTSLGKGMFSSVARALDFVSKRLVAVKIMRNNDALRKGGFTEIAILHKLNQADPDDRKHLVRFQLSFEYKGHLCMVFEHLSLNLREVLKKFGHNIGINLRATRAYAYQIFLALGHMRKCHIIHADLKPDNILVNENRDVLKICDLGTAIDRSDAATAHNEITPYLVSRFYRAPEIILGMPYDYAVDIWSIGCTLYELYTGKILFTGDSNNQMLKTIMEIRGKLTPKLYRRGQLASMLFDDAGNFMSVERDKTLGKTAIRTLAVVKPSRDLRTRLMAASQGMTEAETRELNQFIDLLERCLALNPDKRITPFDALKHPFFTQLVKPAGATR